MVTINATLLVLLGMFLGFLWAMHRVIFAPLLALLDAREAQIAGDRRTATEAAAEAVALEDQYNGEIARMHREANLRLSRARRQAQDEHNAQVAAFKAQAETEVRALGESLAAELRAQEAQAEELARDVCGFLAAKLELE